MAKKVKDGVTYKRLVFARRSNDDRQRGDRDAFDERVVENATVRVFEQDGETRYEADGIVVVPTRKFMDGPVTERREPAVVGFFIEDVLTAEE